QHYADMFGWKEMAATVNEVYQRLSPEEKKDCSIFAQNYGEAAAIDFFGRKYGMPHAISGHNTYWLWGPGNATGKTMIVLGGEEKEERKRVFFCVGRMKKIKVFFIILKKTQKSKKKTPPFLKNPIYYFFSPPKKNPQKKKPPQNPATISSFLHMITKLYI